MDRIIGFDAALLMQLAFHIISVLLLFYILGKLLYNPVREALKKRQEKIASDINEAKGQKEEAAKLKQEYEKKLDGIKAEADEVLAKAHKKATEKEKDIVQEAKQEAQRIIERANLEVEREKEKVRDNIKQEIVEVATLMANKFIDFSIDEGTQNKLIEETINEMGDQAWLN